MERVIGSKVDFTDLSNPDILEFRSYVDDIWSSEMVQRLDNYEQHHKTSRKQHSLNVAYYSFKIAKKIGANPRLSARAGLMHDLYWYDWHTKKIPQWHPVFHPRLAMKNATKLNSDITKREQDAILKHMWPLYPGVPRYKESYAVTMADKYAATLEVATQWSKSIGSVSARAVLKSYSTMKSALRFTR